MLLNNLAQFKKSTLFIKEWRPIVENHESGTVDF
jgi:hypothetical protein